MGGIVETRSETVVNQLPKEQNRVRVRETKNFGFNLLFSISPQKRMQRRSEVDMRHSLRFVLIVTFFSAVLGASTASLAQTKFTIPDDPVAFIGHGMLIDRHGNIIRPDVDFLEKTQEIYIKALRDRLPEAD